MMNKKLLMISFALALAGILFYSNCTYDKRVVLGGSGYPSNIENIVLNKCSTPGCHNTQSKAGAGGLDLSTWDHLFGGSNNGSSVIPYRADQSYLMYFINTYTDLGIHLLPVMPNGQSPLTHDEVVAFRDWINHGAPNKTGFVKWSDNPDRKKIYIINQGCNLVSVLDKETNLVMRVVDVGDPSGSSTNRSAHEIKVTPDNKYWYVIFAVNGNRIEKYDCATDKLIGKISTGQSGSWNSSSISGDGKKVFVVDWASSGALAYIDFENMNAPIPPYYSPTWTFTYPHGACLNNAGNQLYVTGLSGNFYYKMDVTDPLNIDIMNFITPKSLDGHPPNPTSSLNSYSIEFTPDGSKYFISCSGSNEVRVFDAATDTLQAVIPVGIYPSEFSASASQPYLFVTCQDDSITFPGKRGSVYVINYQTNQVVQKIYAGWQPHGIAVDDETHLVYVVNRNTDFKGPAPHHSNLAGCGRNGYITIIDMNTWQLVPNYKTELSSDPFDIAIRF